MTGLVLERDSGLQAEPRKGIRHISERADLEIQKDEGDDALTFAGYMFQWSEVAEIRDFFGTYYEEMEKGSFKKTISERGPKGSKAIKLLVRHDQSVSQGGKFTDLHEDNKGLVFEARTIDTTSGRDLAAEIREGVTNTMSVGFDAIREEFDKDAVKFTVKEAKMYEGSPVLWPAYESGQITSFRAAEVAPMLHRFLQMLETGEELPEQVIGQLQNIRAKIADVLDRPGEIPPGQETGNDHSEDADATLVRLRMAEAEVRTINPEVR